MLLPTEIVVIRSELRLQFPRAPLGADEIAPADPRYPDYEGTRVAHCLAGRQWSEVDSSFLKTNYAGDRSAMLGFMSARGFTYFFPAFLGIALDFPACEDIASSLCQGVITRGSTTAPIFVPPYNSQQIEIIHRGLRYLQAQYVLGEFPTNPAKVALATLAQKYGDAQS
jgi:hypothetical protein